MVNLASARLETQGSPPAQPQTREAVKAAVAQRILDLGITAAEVRQWGMADLERPMAGYLELAGVMEALKGASR